MFLAFLAMSQLPHHIWVVNCLNTLTLETKISSLFKYLVGFLTADTKLRAFRVMMSTMTHPVTLTQSQSAAGCLPSLLPQEAPTCPGNQ